MNKFISGSILAATLSLSQPALAGSNSTNVQSMTREAAEACIKDYSKPKEERRECSKVVLSYENEVMEYKGRILSYSPFVSAIFEKVYGVDQGYTKELFDEDSVAVLVNLDKKLGSQYASMIMQYREIFKRNDPQEIKRTLQQIQYDLNTYSQKEQVAGVNVDKIKKLNVNIEGILRRMG